MSRHRYHDRSDAGRVLAAELLDRVDTSDALVLGLPRGGVPVAAEVAEALQASLDIVVVRKLGFPGHPEIAMGALACVGGTTELVQNWDVMAHLDRLENGHVLYKEVLTREKAELRRRDFEYRAGRPPSEVQGRNIILVDDGLATGASMRAAAVVLVPMKLKRLIVAVPTASPTAVRDIENLVDEVVCPWQPEDFHAVGEAYEVFDQTEDEEVKALLTRTMDTDVPPQE